MPMVRIVHARNALTPPQKKEMIQGVLEAVVAVEGEAMRSGIGVLFEETVENRELALNCLPWVTITLIKDALKPEQRRTMLRNVTEAIVKVEGEEKRFSVWVGLEESIADGEWSIGGKRLTMEAMGKIKKGENPFPDHSSDL